MVYSVYCVLDLHQNVLTLDLHQTNQLLSTSTMDSASGSEGDEKEHDPILDFAIDYLVNGKYSDGLPKDKKRAVRKRAATLELDKGEVFLKRKGRRVKVILDVKEQQRIL